MVVLKLSYLELFENALFGVGISFRTEQLAVQGVWYLVNKQNLSGPATAAGMLLLFCFVASY